MVCSCCKHIEQVSGYWQLKTNKQYMKLYNMYIKVEFSIKSYVLCYTWSALSKDFQNFCIWKRILTMQKLLASEDFYLNYRMLKILTDVIDFVNGPYSSHLKSQWKTSKMTALGSYTVLINLSTISLSSLNTLRTFK